MIGATVGLDGVVAIDVFTYVAAAGLTMLIGVTSHPASSDTSIRILSLHSLINEWREGIRVIWHERTVRTLFIANSFPAIGESVMSVLYIPFVLEVLRGDSLHVGGLMSAQAIGGILGGITIASIATRVKTYRLLGISAVLFGLVDLLLFNYSTFFPGIALAYALIMLAGPLAVGIGASHDTLIQSSVEDAYRGRVFGTFGLTTSLFSLVGIALAGAAGDTFGIVPVINVQGYAYLLLGTICLVALRERYPRRMTVTPTHTG